MNLADLPKQIPGFSTLGEIDVIRLIIWWAHTYATREWVNGVYLRRCYEKLPRALPTGGFTAYFNSLADRKPAQLIRGREGFKLDHRVAEDLAAKYGQRDATVHVEKLLTELPRQLNIPREQIFLEEALICLRHKAYRAAIVMTWNLAYDHLCNWILADATRLSNFNTEFPITTKRKDFTPIAKRDDFEVQKESDVLKVAAAAKLITQNLHKVFKEKLDRRNMAAHPSDISVAQQTAEEVIRDLVENAILKLR